MTVSTINSVAEFVTNGVTKNFPFYFKFLDSRDLVVTYIDPEGTSTVLTMGTQYTVSGAGNDKGGSIATTTVLPGPGQLIVSRDMEAYQQTSLRNQGKFLAETHEDVFDKLTMLIQQGFAIFKRALSRPFGRDYYDAQDRNISNLADPVAGQDAVNKRWTTSFFSDLIDSVTGLINTTPGIIYDSMTLFDYLRSFLYRSVDSIDAMCLLSTSRNQRVRVYSYYGDGKSDSRFFRWDPAMAKLKHNGGTVISPTVPRGILPGNLPAFIARVGDTDPLGVGCWVDENSNHELHVDQFGAIPGNAAYAVSNYAAIRAALSCAFTHYPTRLECNPTVNIGVGEYFVTGQSPLMLNRSEMIALPGAYRYRRGFRVKGCGRGASIITLVTAGAGELYFYSTKDVVFPGDTSVADYVTWDDFTCRGLPEQIAGLPESQKISGLYMESYGWEKHFAARNVDFEGIDRLSVYSGYGNVDHNWFYNCSFRNVREDLARYNNNQSVANGYVGCHAEGLRGSLFSVGPEGGGDVTWVGGSIIQEPKVDASDIPLPSQPARAIVIWDNSGVTAGRSSGLGNNKFTFQGVRIECYEPTQAHVYSYRAGADAYGSLQVVFKDSSFANPHVYNQPSLIPAVPYVGCYLENSISVTYERCDIKSPYTFTVGENDAEIVFEGGRYVPPVTGAPTGGLSAVCSVSGVGGSIIARNVKINQLIAEGDYSRTRVADFTMGLTGRLKAFTAVQGKHPLAPWPQPGVTGSLRIYIPAGSFLKSVTIDKPADAAAAGPADYGLSVVNSSAAIIGSTGTGASNRAIASIMSTPQKIAASPNNYIDIASVGTVGGGAFQSKTGNIVLEYI